MASFREGQRWLPFVVFCAIGLLWLPSLAGPFQFDDYNVIVTGRGRSEIPPNLAARSYVISLKS